MAGLFADTKREVFRQVALERLASPDQLDELMPVTSARAIWALAALGAVLVVTIAWSVVGSIPSEVQGQGIRP